MKWIIKCLLLSLICFACSEIGPTIIPLEEGVIEPPPVENPQKVLIEELTGVRCVNCPAGTAEVLRLQEVYGDRLIAVAVHAGSFAIPYDDSQEAFNIQEANGLLNYLGSPFGYPSAVVNRKLFPDERDLQLSKNLWPAFVEQELEKTADITIEITNRFNATDRALQVDIKLTPLQDIPGNNINLSVMLIEDNVQDVQLTPDGIQNDYNHRHNLRDMLTAFSGNLLNTSLEEGVSVNRNYFYTLPEEWKVEECSIVAFVHYDGELREVMQVEKKDIFE